MARAQRRMKKQDTPKMDWLQEIDYLANRKLREFEPNYRVERIRHEPPTCSIRERMDRERAAREQKGPKQTEVFIYGQGKRTVDSSMVPRERKEHF